MGTRPSLPIEVSEFCVIRGSEKCGSRKSQELRDILEIQGVRRDHRQVRGLRSPAAVILLRARVQQVCERRSTFPVIDLITAQQQTGKPLVILGSNQMRKRA